MAHGLGRLAHSSLLLDPDHGPAQSITIEPWQATLYNALAKITPLPIITLHTKITDSSSPCFHSSYSD